MQPLCAAWRVRGDRYAYLSIHTIKITTKLHQRVVMHYSSSRNRYKSGTNNPNITGTDNTFFYLCAGTNTGFCYYRLYAGYLVRESGNQC